MPAEQQDNHLPDRTKVWIVDVDIPLMSMVVLLIKLAIAAALAAIPIAIIGFLVSAALGVVVLPFGR